MLFCAFPILYWPGKEGAAMAKLRPISRSILIGTSRAINSGLAV